jgi:hypothetical protein
LGRGSEALHPRVGEEYQSLQEWLPHPGGLVIPDATHFLKLERPDIEGRMADALALRRIQSSDDTGSGFAPRAEIRVLRTAKSCDPWTLAVVSTVHYYARAICRRIGGGIMDVSAVATHTRATVASRWLLFGAAVILGASAGTGWPLEASVWTYEGLLQIVAAPGFQIASLAAAVGLGFVLGLVHITSI